MKRATFLAFAILIVPAFARNSQQPPAPQMKPCIAIDEAAVTSVIRIVKLVAKSDYQPGKAQKKKIYDRLPAEPESKGSQK